jgi:putative salt-induced outer membrane protein YdiY
MKKALWLLVVCGVLLYGVEPQTPSQEIVQLKDTSGLSEDEVRKVATKLDNKEGNTTQKLVWENLSPTPVEYDWIQTTSLEWFKGSIEGMYDEKLEFDSDEIGLYSFDFEDVKQIKSYAVMSVNIENLAKVSGILRVKDDDVKVIQGDTVYEFKRKDVVSFAPDAQMERNYWSGKITLSFDLREGNTVSSDAAMQASVKRRTSDSTLSLDYLGRISSNNGVEIANDHRFNEKYDLYITRYFFWTPLFSEYYTDRYKNISSQITLGLGVGYTLVKTKVLEWSLSGGPAVIYTNYATVENGEQSYDYSPAFEVSTSYEKELSSITDFTYNSKFTLTNTQAGSYKHHMIFLLENELLSWLDLDMTVVWDYVHTPQIDADGIIPKRNDYQFLIGFGIEI